MACQCINIKMVGNAFRGDSFLNPLSELEMYEAVKLNDWKDLSLQTPCIETDDGVNFYVHTNIQVGDGTTPTYLIIEGKNIIFDMGKGWIKMQNSYLQVSSVWTPAEKALIFSQLEAIRGNQEIRNAEISDVSPTKTRFDTTLTESIDDFWNRGALKMTSGQNEGVIRKIQTYTATGNEVCLRTQLPYTPANGDTFTIIPLRCFRINYSDLTEISNRVWDEAISEHTQVGSFGSENQNADLVKRILGLSHENIYMYGQAYDANGNTLSCYVRTYENAADCHNNVNQLETYLMVSEYNSEQRLSSFKMTVST